MRWVLSFALLLAGCPGGFGNGNGSCEVDGDCGGEVCANVHTCYPADQVERVAIRWTVDGQPASATVCTSAPVLDLTIVDPAGSQTATFGPVECSEGQFTFTKLPTLYDEVQLSAEATGVTGAASIPPGGGDVSIDLAYGNVLVDAGTAP